MAGALSVQSASCAHKTPQAYALIQKAMALKERASPKEQAYIDALATRYSEAANPDRQILVRANVEAMRHRIDVLMARFPWTQMVLFSELAPYGPLDRYAHLSAVLVEVFVLPAHPQLQILSRSR